MIKEIRKTIYICDCCKKEFDASDLKEGLNKCTIPIIYYFDREKQTINKSIGLCDECNEKFKDAIREHFHKFCFVWCGSGNVEDDK